MDNYDQFNLNEIRIEMDDGFNRIVLKHGEYALISISSNGTVYFHCGLPFKNINMDGGYLGKLRISD